MMLVRRVARPMLASIFVLGGLDAFRNPAPKAPAADDLLGEHLDEIPVVTTSSQLVRADGGLKVIGGLALALNRVPRLAAAGLAVSLVPTTLAGHRFWEETDPAQRSAQQIHFAKNAAILGGLLLAVADRTGSRSAS